MGCCFPKEKASVSSTKLTVDSPSTRSFEVELQWEFLKRGAKRWLWWGRKEQLWSHPMYLVRAG